MTRWLTITAIVLALAGPRAAGAQSPAPEPVKALKVTVLSTMLAGNPGHGIGEWGFAALLEVDGRQILIDTGERPETVLRNAAELGIDLSGVTDVVLTHNHSDHTGGLIALRTELAKKNSKALSRAHVGKGIFLSRLDEDGRVGSGILHIKAAYEALGGTFIEHDGPTRLLPGVWFTGPIPRTYPERNWSTSLKLQTPAGPVEDNIPEDSSVVVETPSGLVVISGCAHAGIINIMEYSRKAIRNERIHAAIGGFHLFPATDQQLDWTGGKMREFGLEYLFGAHCTGVEAVYHLREVAGLSRRAAVVSAVGSSFTLGKGLNPLSLAR
jgi:7,8-dihydropterin-6-yl-methyl-4-(beta-D-ribofuranosyl)aminobenzene 5'-phosphate synthase